MLLNVTRVRQCLRSFDFQTLFIEELGWDHCFQHLDVPIDERSFTLNAVAEKRGMVAFIYAPSSDGKIPDPQTRRKIERQTAKSVREHLIIYTDTGKTTQVWQWVKHEAGKPSACREHTYHRDQPGDALIQKLQTIAFSFEEEDRLYIVDVTSRVRAAFDVDRVTKRFYDRFKAEHASFLSFIKGIPDEELQRWYASVMLNRLMFIYFIQKKGFLDDDTNYLRTKLGQIKAHSKDRFYADFLCPLFFDGFARKEEDRATDIQRLLGKVPYLNGGIFLRHQIEELHGRNIQIGDDAFEKLFAFFDQYQWHLDERPLRNDNEINPDVLGYIFEKYINQKQMGAYYTKEDITEYISKNTIIPFLFDTAYDKCRIAFVGARGNTIVGANGRSPLPDTTVWRLLSDDPDRYIYDAVKKGMDLPLPDEIALGLDDVSRRAEWNKPAPAEHALPTEIWREVVARQRRYEEVHAKLANGEIRSINDLITYNLDIRQFAQDVIQYCEGTELLKAFWHAIERIKVLDPTCGSGAFLFAALNILETLYEACIDRMQMFVDELDRSGEKHSPKKYDDFRKVLGRMSEHPNPRYFILKSIIVNNLYGVDIMEEAIEICKLRMFLKLVAQVEDVDKIEPLPDIDFNVRAGNTLVGFATYEDVKKAVSSNLLYGEIMERIEEKAQDLDGFFSLFQEMQTEQGMSPQDFMEAKLEVRQRMKALEDELNRYLAGEYGVDVAKREACDKWLALHKPFHWFIEFYSILNRGGFDVIIGNPPYVEYSKIKRDYTIRGYSTENCGNLYVFVMERSLALLQNNGALGMIVPLSMVSTERMKSLQSLIGQNKLSVWLSLYDVYPCKLFEGAKQRLCIAVAHANTEDAIFTTKYNRWKPEERESLFQNLFYWKSYYNQEAYVIPKLQDSGTETILRKLERVKPAAFIQYAPHVSFYIHQIPYNYIKAFDFAPYFWNEVDGEKISVDYKSYCLAQRNDERIVLATLNSNLFFWWWYTISDGYHCCKYEVHSFPIGLEKMLSIHRSRLIMLADDLMTDLTTNKKRKVCQYQKTGRVEYDEFYPRYSKPIIDEIDRVLAQHYGFTDEELDFIINYDIKYRMGRESGEDDE